MQRRKNIIPYLLVLLTALLALMVLPSWGAAQADHVTVLAAERLSCGSCAAKITAALEKKEGVASVDVDIAAAKVTVRHDKNKIAPERLAEVVTETGYPSRVVQTLTKDAFEKASGNVPPESKNVRTGCACCNKK